MLNAYDFQTCILEGTVGKVVVSLYTRQGGGNVSELLSVGMAFHIWGPRNNVEMAKSESTKP